MKSFAQRVRGALIMADTLQAAKPCCRLAELSGFVHGGGAITPDGQGAFQIAMRLENPGTVRLIVKLLRATLSVSPTLRVTGTGRPGGRRMFTISLSGADAQTVLRALDMYPAERKIPRHCMLKKCCRSAFMRGIFLGCGTITAPEHGYLIEFSLQDARAAEALADFLGAYYAFAVKTKTRRGMRIVYTKDYASITGILSLIGAAGAILEMENMRIMRDARNRANRAANCDAANVSKLVGAADRQQRAIERIDRSLGLEALPETLREIAAVRRHNPDISLEELGQRLTPPVSKSGVYHRLRRLMKIAESMEAPTTSIKEERT